MSYDAILGRSSGRRRTRLAGSARCDPILSPGRPVEMLADQQGNEWVRREAQRVRRLPDDERVIVIPGGAP